MEPVPVPFEGRKGKGKAPKGKGDGKNCKKKAKKVKRKSKSSIASPESSSSVSPPIVNKGACIASFPEAYQSIIKSLPVPLWPSSEKHGQHSYTVWLV